MSQDPGKKRNGIVVCLGSGQAVALVLVSLMLLGLSFSLGMRAGRALPNDVAEVAPSAKGSDRLGDLDAKAEARRAEAEKKAGASEANAREVLAQTSEKSATATESASPENNASTVTSNGATPAKADGQVSHQKTTKGQAVVASVTTSSEAKTTISAPSAASVAPKRTGFALQTSSLPSEKAAQDEVRRLEKRGLSAWYTAAEVKGSTTYRVKVGPYETKDEAMKDFDRVTEKAGGKPMVANAN